MNCHHTPQIDALHDGQLPAGQAALLREHVGACADCRAALASRQAISRMLDEAWMEEPTDQAMERWSGALQDNNDRRLRQLTGWMTAAAAVVVACGLWSVNGSAQADPIFGNWEQAMLSEMDEPTSSSVMFARWIAVDLSHDSSPPPGDELQ